jgi:hypothetical protein
MERIEIIKNLIICIGVINNLVILIGAIYKKVNRTNFKVKKSNVIYITLIVINIVLFSIYGVLRNYK